MRASDILRLAWKNLKEEKKKSWLTGFVVLLINSILCFISSFSAILEYACSFLGSHAMHVKATKRNKINPKSV